MNSQYDIVHLSEHASRFLQMAGEPSRNVLEVVHPALRLELRTALFCAMHQQSNVTSAPIPFEEDGRRFVTLHVRPTRSPDASQAFLLVVFEPTDEGREVPMHLSASPDALTGYLQEEVQHLRQQLSATIGQYEASLEELKAANEEHQSNNEEMRSTTEELETSKEELQSTNEELTTVNQELKSNLDELGQANGDLQNLMAATEIGTIFLDKQLRIKRFTPRIRELFNVIPTDIGRPLSDITHKLNYHHFTAEAERVLADLSRSEREVRSNGHAFLARMLPYRTQNDYIDGVVLTFIDITERKQVEAALRASEMRMRLIVESARDYAIFTTDLQRHVTSWNVGAQAIFGYTEAEILGSLGDVLFTPEDRMIDGPQQEVDNAQATGRAENERWHVRKDGSRFYGSGVTMSLHDDTESLIGYVKIMRDLTEQQQTRQEVQEQADRDPLTHLLNHRAFQKQMEEEAGRARREKTTLAIVMLDLDNFKFFNDAYGHAVGDEVLRLVAQRLQQVCRPYDTVARFGGDEFALLLPGVGHTLATEVEARLRKGMAGLVYEAGPEGAAIPITVSVGAALFPHDGEDWHEALSQADARLLRSKTGGEGETETDRFRVMIRRSVEGFSLLDALVVAVNNKDRYTRKHSEDVVTYCLLIAHELGLSQAEQRTIATAALLHDVGKIGVPDAILRKPGRLTDAEFEAVKQPPQMGAILVAAIPGLEDTLGAVRHHHERWDGQGYPLGLQAKETPLLARVMAVADAFSAMTTDRPYRKGFAEEEAEAILSAGAGSQWDAECVAAFLSAQQNKRARNGQAPQIPAN